MNDGRLNSFGLVGRCKVSKLPSLKRVHERTGGRADGQVGKRAGRRAGGRADGRTDMEVYGGLATKRASSIAMGLMSLRQGI